MQTYRRRAASGAEEDAHTHMPKMLLRPKAVLMPRRCKQLSSTRTGSRLALVWPPVHEEQGNLERRSNAKSKGQRWSPLSLSLFKF